MATATENPLTVMSRETMQGLKAKTDEVIRLSKVKEIISRVYSDALDTARRSSNTQFIYPLDDNLRQQFQMNDGRTCYYQLAPINIVFDAYNKEDILGGLRRLFPGCSIEYKNLMMNPRDGKMYDISKIDTELRHLINGGISTECIVIDWS